MKISPRFASHRHLLHVRLLPVALGFSACLAEDFPLIADSNRSPRKRNRSLDTLWHAPVQISDIENSSSRDARRKSEPSARDGPDSPPETGLSAANLRKRRHFRDYPKYLARDPAGWLTTQS